MNHPEYIVLHHSATKDTETLSWPAIRRNHVNIRKFRTVGYHYGVEKVGNSFEIIQGRFPHEIGAHCREAGMNRRSVGICCVGNYDVMAPPPALLFKLRGLVEWLIIEYEIPPQNIIGHRDAGLMEGYDWEKGQYKTCPGKLFDLFAFKQQFAA